MIQFFHNDFLTLDNKQLSEWLVKVANKEGFIIQKLHYNFVDARKLYELNQKYLNHDNDTDILTFDYSVDNEISAEAFISHDALEQNAKINNQSIEKETLRLLSHALLHCFGHPDKSPDEKLFMRLKEEECIAMFHVKQ
jgi:rRNA maturation RNase YbeY